MNNELKREFRELGCIVYAAPEEYRVCFQVYTAMWDEQGQVYFSCGDGSFSPHLQAPEVAPEFTGSVKWDSCSNWDLGYFHGCSREDLGEVGEVMMRCWDWAKELLPNWMPY